MMTTAQMIAYDQYVDMGIATPEELNLAFNLIGNWDEVFTKVLYYRTGYRTWDQMMEDEDEEA